MAETISHEQVAAEFRIPDECLTREEYEKRRANSRILVAPTGLLDHLDREQVVVVRTDVACTAENSPKHVLAFEGMAVTDDPQRESSIGHNAGISAFVKCRTGEDISIISVGNPGVANPLWRPKIGKDQTYGLTFAQAVELWHGEFNLVSLALARAARYAMEVEGLVDASVVRNGTSLDGSNASSSIGHMLDTGMNLRRIALIDPVGLSREKGRKRMEQFFKIESPEAYLATNHIFHRELIETNAEWTARAARSPANLLYGLRGVSLGGAAGALEESADTMREHDVSLRVYAAGASSFDTVPGAVRTVENLQRRGVDAKLQIIKGASHAATMMAGLHGQTVVDYIQGN